MQMHDIHKACLVQDEIVLGTYQLWNQCLN